LWINAKKAGGKTLELGCGTGRVLIPTALAGREITGLDLSPFMLQKCREKVARLPAETRKNIRLIQGDMTKICHRRKSTQWQRSLSVLFNISLQ